MATVKLPGIIGLPDETKEAGKRVDFRPTEFDLALEHKGARLAWSRSCMCPCDSVNDQTEQADINCALCDGVGWLEFEPRGAVVNPKVIGSLDALQTKIVSDTNSAVVMGLQTGIVANNVPYDKVEKRIQGTCNFTTRPENKIGFNDRLVNLDAKIVYSQLLTNKGSGFVTRYPIVEVNLLRSDDVVYVEDTNFSIVEGAIDWITTAPAATDKLAIHYLTYPYWRVVEHPHMTRQTLIKHKIKNPTLPRGTPTDLPVMAVAKLEFLL